MSNDLLQRFRVYLTRMDQPQTPDDVKLMADIERAIEIASKVEPHLPAVRAAITLGSPPGGRSIHSPAFEQIAYADARARADGSRRS